METIAKPRKPIDHRVNEFLAANGFRDAAGQCHFPTTPLSGQQIDPGKWRK